MSRYFYEEELETTKTASLLGLLIEKTMLKTSLFMKRRAIKDTSPENML